MRGIRKSPSQIRKGNTTKQGDIQPELVEKAKKAAEKAEKAEKKPQKPKKTVKKAKPTKTTKPIKSSLLAFMSEKKIAKNKDNDIDFPPIKNKYS